MTFDVHTLLYAAGATVLGFQAMQFWAFSKIYGALEGVVPEDRRLSAFTARVGLETALIAGGALVLLGLALGITTLVIWGGENFGALAGRGALRLAIASVTAMILGFQLALGAFFITVLGMLRAAPGRR